MITDIDVARLVIDRELQCIENGGFMLCFNNNMPPVTVTRVVASIWVKIDHIGFDAARGISAS
jgi:hypothetical protein